MHIQHNIQVYASDDTSVLGRMGVQRCDMYMYMFIHIYTCVYILTYTHVYCIHLYTYAHTYIYWNHGPERTKVNATRRPQARLWRGYSKHPQQSASAARLAHLVGKGPRRTGFCRPAADASRHKSETRSSRKTPSSRWHRGPMRRSWSVKPAVSAVPCARTRREGRARSGRTVRSERAVHR